MGGSHYFWSTAYNRSPLTAEIQSPRKTRKLKLKVFHWAKRALVTAQSTFLNEIMSTTQLNKELRHEVSVIVQRKSRQRRTQNFLFRHRVGVPENTDSIHTHYPTDCFPWLFIYILFISPVPTIQPFAQFESVVGTACGVPVVTTFTHRLIPRIASVLQSLILCGASLSRGFCSHSSRIKRSCGFIRFEPNV